MAECLIECELEGLGRFLPGDDIPVEELSKKRVKNLVRRGVIAQGDDD